MFFKYIFALFYFVLVKESHQKCKDFQNLINYNETIIYGNYSYTSNVISQTFIKKINNNMIYGRFITVNNPLKSINILQPNNDNRGCEKKEIYTTSQTAKKAGNCEVAINAGFFYTKTKECIGNIINDGVLYLNSGGIVNANFGIKKNGNLFFGYLGSKEVISNDFNILVSGVIWLLQNGKSVVQNSIEVECNETQETGTLDYFAKVISARTAVGAMKNGTVVLVHVEGKTNGGGINLFDFATLLQEMEVVSAINLDGGGSATMVINRTLVSYPSDGCSLFTCERPVSTVLCVRAECPSKCPSSTHCMNGFCEPDSIFSTSTWWYITLIGAIIGSIILLGITGVLVQSVIRHRNRSLKTRWSKNEARLVLYENDDYVHFDNQPLMDEDNDFLQEL